MVSPAAVAAHRWLIVMYIIMAGMLGRGGGAVNTVWKIAVIAR